MVCWPTTQESMSDLIESNLSRDLLASVQEKKLTKEGWSKTECRACGGKGKLLYDGRPVQCPSCRGAGVKWRPGVVVKV